jgi:hypothetical protein
MLNNSNNPISEFVPVDITIKHIETLHLKARIVDPEGIIRCMVMAK